MAKSSQFIVLYCKLLNRGVFLGFFSRRDALSKGLPAGWPKNKSYNFIFSFVSTFIFYEKKRLLRAKKILMANIFLTNEDIAMKHCQCTDIERGKNQRCLEVGPRAGVFLTKYLLEKKKIDLIVVEADRDMVDHLHLKLYPTARESNQ